MSAVNPLPASDHGQGGHEKRAYEPSMEEILASIRRIIADDQSLPKQPPIDPPPAAAVEPVHQPSIPVPTPFPDLRAVTSPAPPQEPVDADAAAPQIEPTPHVEPVASFPLPEAAPSEFARDPLEAYESIAAPQFPVPHGPVGDEILSQAPSYETAGLMSEFGAEEVAEEPATATATAEPASFRTQHATARTAPIGDDDALYDTPIDPPRPRATQRPGPSLFSDATDSSVSSAFNMLAASRLADNSDELLNLAREMIRPLLRTWLDDNLPSMVERMVRAEIERVARGGGR